MPIIENKALTEGEIFAALKTIIKKQLKEVPAKEIKRTSSIMYDLRADSLDKLDIVMQAEQAFKVSIPDEDACKLNTVQDFISYIKERA